MEPVVTAGALLLLVAVAMLPFLLVVVLLLGALRSIIDAKPWLHDEVAVADAWAATDRRPGEHGRTDTAIRSEGVSDDDVPRPFRARVATAPGAA